MAHFYAVITKFHDKHASANLSERSEKVKHALIEQVPALTGKWVAKFAFDSPNIGAIDIVAHEHRHDVERAAAIIRELGGVETEVVAAATWPHFLTGKAFS
jgi:hypothetical protein